MAPTKQRGFSMLELMIVISISLILAAVTYMGMRPMMFRGHINEGYDTTLMVLRNTRNLAITQSHEYYVNFNPAGFAAGTLQVEYQPPAATVGGALPPLEQVMTYSIPTDISFAIPTGTGFPTGTANTPDGFGTGVTAIDFGQALATEPLNFVVFMPDGSSQDNLGNFNSGIVYLMDTALPTNQQLGAARAITVWGTTGRIRGWTLNQTAATSYVWVQQ
jgi:prepilin-type N-terminal cleavage/methylation domain-containing protein